MSNFSRQWLNKILKKSMAQPQQGDTSHKRKLTYSNGLNLMNPTHQETLVGSGHMSPRIWESKIKNKQLRGGVDKCEICLYKV